MKVVVELDIHTVRILGRLLVEFWQNLLPLLTTPDVCMQSDFVVQRIVQSCCFLIAF